MVDDIFRNFSKGEHASKKEMEETFDTQSAKDVIKKILTDGA